VFELNKIIHADCMNIMKDIPDKYFELAIVDPPYGIGAGSEKFKNGTSKNNIGYKIKDWDILPDEKYFNELFRISQNQIIWGGNYFITYLRNTKCFIVWDKLTGKNSYADAEIAWTSFDSPIKIYKKFWLGANAKNETPRIHPTEKPVALYRWLLQHYAKKDDKIFDSHVGSGSSLIACIEGGFDFVGCEIDKDYYIDTCERIKNTCFRKELFSLPNKKITSYKTLF
jgi:site-specific DNA-methyltransferase (adenine-specific)